MGMRPIRKYAWLFVVFLVGGLYFLSSIPGLRVLPVLSQIHALLSGFDILFIRFSEWIAGQVPVNYGELRHFDQLTQDVLAYSRDNPIIIEFFLRKLAHVFVFFMITIALFFLYHQYIRSSWIAVMLAYISGGILAFLDEYRQSFVDNRYSSNLDVFIDMIGVTLATGLILFSLFITKAGRKHFYSNNKEIADHKEITNNKEITDSGKPFPTENNQSLENANPSTNEINIIPDSDKQSSIDINQGLSEKDKESTAN